MSDGDKDKKPEARITVLAKSFTPAAMEFHRRNMAAQGYRIEGRVSLRKFYLTDGLSESEPLFGGEPHYAVTFVRVDED